MLSIFKSSLRHTGCDGDPHGLSTVIHPIQGVEESVDIFDSTSYLPLDLNWEFDEDHTKYSLYHVHLVLVAVLRVSLVGIQILLVDQGSLIGAKVGIQPYFNHPTLIEPNHLLINQQRPLMLVNLPEPQQTGFDHIQCLAYTQLSNVGYSVRDSFSQNLQGDNIRTHTFILEFLELEGGDQMVGLVFAVLIDLKGE